MNVKIGKSTSLSNYTCMEYARKEILFSVVCMYKVIEENRPT